MRCMKKFFIAQIIAVSIFVQSLVGMDSEPVLSETNSNVNRAVLIFLDDSESDDSQTADRKLGAITNAFIAAFSQEAGPILVSASLIANIKEREKSQKTDPQKLVDRVQALMSQSPTDIVMMEYKSIVLSVISFNKTTTQNWIIKKVNDALYLLLPKHYLVTMHIPEAAIQGYQPGGSPLTTTELQLGLKVNHMQTVINIDDIKKPLPEPPIVTYFMDSVWDNKLNTSNIFVTNSDYHKSGSIAIPTWSLFIKGHGIMGATIAGIVFSQFKELLNFLEYKINTKLFYYVSCYAAGIANKALYEDAESGIDTTYSFAIITQALTDSVIIIPITAFDIKDDKLVITTPVSYTKFISNVTAADIIDYHTIDPYHSKMGIAGFPQIKFPGLPWFSIIDDDLFCMIGLTLAKARITPLNIANFFAKGGKKATPIGLLLYTQDIPFELIIDSKNMVGIPPFIISMIPGNALHCMKKISTTVYTVDDILQSFLGIKHLGPQKVFIIDSIQGINDEGNAVVVQDVTIHLTPQQNSVYYLQDGKLLKIINKNVSEEGNSKDKERHAQLLAIANPTKSIISTEQMIALTAEANKIFAQKMNITDMHKQIVELLDTMPNDSIIRIPHLNGISCLPDENCWFELLYALSQYTSFGIYKIIYFDSLIIYNQEDQQSVILRDIIVDVNKQKTEVFCTAVNTKKMLIVSSKTGMNEQKEPYISTYTDILSYFNTHMTLPEKVVKGQMKTYDLLTKTAISDIAQVQEKKAQKIGEQRLKERAEKCEQNRPWWRIW
jgi:hypothetical protein